MLPNTESHDAERRGTEAWAAAYSNSEEITRRRAALPAKLERLGLAETDRSIRILDLCCGNGEALDALYGMGFRNLYGGDITISEELAGDSRFQVKVCDAANPPFESGTFDWIIIVHAMHHLGLAAQIKNVIEQCERMLKPGGRLSVIDFPNSLQIRLAFWWFRLGWFQWTPYLKHFGAIIREEWPFLKDYLPQFNQVRKLLLEGNFETERRTQDLFYFYWTLRKRN